MATFFSEDFLHIHTLYHFPYITCNSRFRSQYSELDTYFHVVCRGEIKVLVSFVRLSLIHPGHAVKMLELLRQTDTGTAVGSDVDTREAFLTTEGGGLL